MKKLEKKSLVSYLYIGKPLPQYQGQYGTSPRLQLNDKFSKIEDIPYFIEEEKKKEKRKRIRPRTSSFLVLERRYRMTPR